jgi:hypothetical protein
LTRTGWALVGFLALCLPACYRTYYARFSPPRADESRPQAEYLPDKKTGWQSFFVYGWAPGEKEIDAVALCGSADSIHSIRTRRTFLEGLVAAFAGYYINIYSPWDGAVYCAGRGGVAETEALKVPGTREPTARPPQAEQGLLVPSIELPPDPPPLGRRSEVECLAWQAYMEADLDGQADEARAALIAQRAKRPDSRVVDDAWRSVEAQVEARRRYIKTNSEACRAAAQDR